MNLTKHDFQRILIIKPSSLGDIVHGLPVLHGLRKRYPAAQIDWLIAKPFAPLLQGHPDLNELVIFDRTRFSKLGRSRKISLEFLRFIRDLHRRSYDLVIDLQGLFRTGFLSLASGSPIRIGPADAREGARFFYNHRLPRCPVDTHAVDRNYQVAQMLGFADQPIRFPLPIDPQSRYDAEQLIESIIQREEPGNDLGTRKSIVAVVPGARWETKRWPAERFATMVDLLHQNQHVRCVLLGGPENVEICQTIEQQCRQPPLDLAGKTSLPQFTALISLADLVICQDSAAAHLATALDRPLICLIGPTNPARTGPYRRPEDILRVAVECSPCYWRRLKDCHHQHRCMADLDVHTVMDTARQSLQAAENENRTTMVLSDD